MFEIFKVHPKVQSRERETEGKEERKRPFIDETHIETLSDDDTRTAVSLESREMSRAKEVSLADPCAIETEGNS